MDTATLLKADYLDILYNNRNKQYGSYELRKHYTSRAASSLIIICSLGIALAIYGLIKNDDSPLVNKTTCNIPIELSNIIPPPLHVRKPKPAVTGASKPTIANTPPIVIDDHKITVSPPDVDDLTAEDSGPVTATGDATGIRTPSAGTGTILPATAPPVAPIKWSEQMPEFIGNMNEYLSKELQYPQHSREMGIEGQVVVQFVVNEDGSISDARVVRGIGGGCNEEALRVINAMPRWKPGKQNGKAVKVYYTIPIRFLLQ